jgi:hypothetical protein
MKKTHHGGCHCGKVRFEADFDLDGGTFRCNCTMCFKSRAWLAPVGADAFRLLSGKEDLRDYQFAKKRLHHFFCTTCGVRPFSRGSDAKGNESYAVRVNCLEGVAPEEFTRAPVKYFDMLHDDLKTPPEETRHL